MRWRQTKLVLRCHWENSNEDLSWRQNKLILRSQRKQRGIPEKVYLGIFIPKGHPIWHQKETNSEVPAGQFLRRENFYVDICWRQKEIIPKCQRENFAPVGKFYGVYDIYVDLNFAPVGQFLRSVKFLRRSELVPKEIIPRRQRDIFVPTEFEIQIWV